MTQYEEQEVGIQWHNTFQSAIDRDQFNYGYNCLILLFDSCLYAAVGFLVLSVGEKRKQSGGRISQLFSRLANCWLISIDIGKEEETQSTNIIKLS